MQNVTVTESVPQQSAVVHLGKKIQIPYLLLERMIEERYRYIIAIQRNNHLVAVSVLKSCVVSFLQFERSFKSLLSKGDDNTQIDVIKCAISELRTATQSYDSLLDKEDPCRFFITEPGYAVDLRELFLQCIKILIFMLHLLGGKDSSLDTSSNTTNNWQGWKQVAEQISLSNNVLYSLVMAHVKELDTKPTSPLDVHFEAIVEEVSLFSTSVLHVTESFLRSSYPTKERILQIYQNASVPILRYMTIHTTSAVTATKDTPVEEKKRVSLWF